jgi:hypothetical protein
MDRLDQIDHHLPFPFENESGQAKGKPSICSMADCYSVEQ